MAMDMFALHLTYEPGFDEAARVYVHRVVKTILPDGTAEIDPDFDEIIDRFDFTIEENDSLLDTFDGNHYIDEYGLWPSNAANLASWIAHCADVSPRFAAWLKTFADTPTK